jgi:hypothetical protein
MKVAEPRMTETTPILLDVDSRGERAAGSVTAGAPKRP